MLSEVNLDTPFAGNPKLQLWASCPTVIRYTPTEDRERVVVMKHDEAVCAERF